MDFIRAHQLNIMLVMIGGVGILALMTMMPKFVARRKKIILTLMEIASLVLLIFDRFSYIYDGNATRLGGIMVRVSNGLCYLMFLFIPFLATHFIHDMLHSDAGIEKPPMRLLICDAIFVVGSVLLAVSQFTGLYYTFDAGNSYKRAPLNFISYIIPFLMVVLQESVILQYRSKIRSRLALALAAAIIMPVFAAILQFLIYGVSFMSVTMAVVVAFFFIYSLCSLGEDMDNARKRELEFYKEAKKVTP